MKWGTRYGPEFVNRLYSSIKRHTLRPTRYEFIELFAALLRWNVSVGLSSIGCLLRMGG